MSIDLATLKLPTTSQIGLRLFDDIGSDDFDINTLADTLSADAVISASLLKYANSPLRSRQSEVTNIRNAIQMLGIKNVKLVIAIAVMRALNGGEEHITELVWRHSYRISLLSRLIAGACNPAITDDVVITALMHEMGALILSANFPDEYGRAFNLSSEKGIPLERSELNIFGIHRGTVIVSLAQRIGLPQVTIDALTEFFVHAPIFSLKKPREWHRAILTLAHHMEWLMPPRDLQLEEDFRYRIVNGRMQSLESLSQLLKLDKDRLKTIFTDYLALLSNNNFVF